jgi:outer membrane protein TolC
VGPGQEPTAAAPLTLGALLAEVEAQNPRLQALRAQVRAAGERPAQVATLDDPTLMVELWQVPWDVASVPLMFTLRQPLPWPGKLRARAAVLAPEAARARAEVGVTAAELRLQACRSYYAYWLAVRADQVLRQLRELLGGTVAAVAARYRTGRAELVELLRAQEAVVNLDNQLLDTERERELAVTALNTLRGAEPPTRLGLPVSAPTVRPLPEVTALWARALAQRPELLAVQAAAAQARARGLAAQKERAPDLAVWTSLMKDLRGTQDTFTVGVQASIPSFSLARYGAAGREARAQGQAAQSELQAVQQQIRGEVQQAVLRLLTTGRHLALHSGSLIPLSEQAARAAEAGFQSGRVSLAQLLETARMLSEHHLEYERYLAEYGQRWAELEAATGGPISDGQSPDGGDATGVGGRQ